MKCNSEEHHSCAVAASSHCSSLLSWTVNMNAHAHAFELLAAFSMPFIPHIRTTGAWSLSVLPN